jgi:uncharacterized delta-60 repeat protein
MPRLDSSFGSSGFVAQPFSSVGHNFNVGTGVALQTDGKIVVGGYSGGLLTPGDFVVARFDIHGHLDPTFGSGGFVVTDFGGNEQATGLAIQRDGKIVLVGWTDAHGGSEFALARYNLDGSPDISFGSNGQVTTHFGPPLAIAGANAVALDAHGNIITGKDTIAPPAV